MRPDTSLDELDVVHFWLHTAPATVHLLSVESILLMFVMILRVMSLSTTMDPLLKPMGILSMKQFTTSSLHMGSSPAGSASRRKLVIEPYIVSGILKMV